MAHSGLSVNRSNEGGEHMGRLLVVLCLLIAVLVVPSAADQYFIGLTGSGGLLENRAAYAGEFSFGFTGTWKIIINDGGWASHGDPDARFASIWKTFFAGNYDATPGAEAWYGYFDGTTQRRPPRFSFRLSSPKGQLEGDAALVIMVRDANGDGVLSEAEKAEDCQVTATLAVDYTRSKGAFRGMCGSGALGGGTFNFAYPPEVDDLELVGTLTLYDCPKGELRAGR
jgi:hypothetical protein